MSSGTLADPGATAIGICGDPLLYSVRTSPQNSNIVCVRDFLTNKYFYFFLISNCLICSRSDHAVQLHGEIVPQFSRY